MQLVKSLYRFFVSVCVFCGMVRCWRRCQVYTLLPNIYWLQFHCSIEKYGAWNFLQKNAPLCGRRNDGRRKTESVLYLFNNTFWGCVTSMSFKSLLKIIICFKRNSYILECLWKSHAYGINTCTLYFSKTMPCVRPKKHNNWKFSFN